MEKGYRPSAAGSSYDRTTFDRNPQDDVELAALNFMTSEEIKTHTPKQLKSLVKKYQERHEREDHGRDRESHSMDVRGSGMDLMGEMSLSGGSGGSEREPTYNHEVDLWADFSAVPSSPVSSSSPMPSLPSPPASPKMITLPTAKKSAVPARHSSSSTPLMPPMSSMPTTPSITASLPPAPTSSMTTGSSRSSRGDGGGMMMTPTSFPSLSSLGATSPPLHLPEKTRALQQVLDQIDREFGECNEKIKEQIRQVTILYTSTNQKILSNSFTPKERDSIYTLTRPSNMEKYQQLYKLFLELHRERNMLTNSVYQTDPSLKSVHEYMEGRQQTLADLLRKYRTILESTEE